MPAKTTPEGFVFLSDVDSSIIQDVRYFSDNNFVGNQIPGYESPSIMCTRLAAENLSKANQFFQQLRYTIVVYDGYRPQRAVDYFNKWAQDSIDTKMKQYYYPTLQKQQILDQGYIAPTRSSHTRGSTFDLTLIEKGKQLQTPKHIYRTLNNGDVIIFLDDNTVDAGGSFDLFHKASNHGSDLISSQQTEIRNFLRSGLEKYGFEAYQPEWWHYTLKNEPYPDQYFDFEIRNKT